MSTTKSPDPHSRWLRGGRWSEAYACFAISKTLADRRPILHQPAVAQILLSTIDYQRQQQRIKLLGFCMMPDHFHLLLVLLDVADLSDVVASMCKYSSRHINQVLDRQGQLWQEGFYDHRCRNNDDVESLLYYLEDNPVAAGLVDEQDKWQYSSANKAMNGYLDRQWWYSVQ